MMTPSPLLEVVDLSRRFGGVKAVDSVSFTLEKAQLLGVIGPNGSGKTTLVNLITGFRQAGFRAGDFSVQGHRRDSPS